MRKCLSLLVLCLLSCTQTPTLVITEPNILGTLDPNSVGMLVLRLEHPRGASGTNDLDQSTGQDNVAFDLAFGGSTLGTVRLCFEHPEPHTLSLLDRAQRPLVSVIAGSNCAEAMVPEGRNVLRVAHADAGDRGEEDIVFVRVLSEGNTVTFRATRDCPGCRLASANLSHATLTGINLSGADLSGANLRASSLRGARIEGASFTGTNLTDTLLDADMVVSSPEVQHEWVNASGTLRILARFNTQTSNPMRTTLEFQHTVNRTSLGIIELPPDGSSVSFSNRIIRTDRVQATFERSNTSPTDGSFVVFARVEIIENELPTRFDGPMFRSPSTTPSPPPPPPPPTMLDLVNDQAAPVSVVVMHRNENAQAPVIAWTTLRNVPQNTPQTLRLDHSFTASTTDTLSNTSPVVPTTRGEALAIDNEIPRGPQLLPAGISASPRAIEVLTGINTANFGVQVFRGGRLAFQQTNMQPNARASFDPGNTLLFSVTNTSNPPAEGTTVPREQRTEVTEVGLLDAASVSLHVVGSPSTGFRIETRNLVRR